LEQSARVTQSDPRLRRKEGDGMSKPLAIGEKTPSFQLPGTDGRTLGPEDFKGRKLVLYFYPKDDTSGCTLEAQEFEKLRKKFEAKGADVVGVSPDSLARHEKFKTKHDLKFLLLSDQTKKMLEAYGVWVEKSMYGRKYMGVERTTVLVGPNGRIARIWNKVKPAGHAAEVLEAASAL
jgi:thioredoxin-dependent peroxiredoxin